MIVRKFKGLKSSLVKSCKRFLSKYEATLTLKILAHQFLLCF